MSIADIREITTVLRQLMDIMKGTWPCILQCTRTVRRRLPRRVCRTHVVPHISVIYRVVWDINVTVRKARPAPTVILISQSLAQNHAVQVRTGFCFNMKTIFPSLDIPIIKIRCLSIFLWSWDHLIFIIRIPILIRQHHYIEMALRCQKTAFLKSQFFFTHWIVAHFWKEKLKPWVYHFRFDTIVSICCRCHPIVILGS